MDWVPVLARAAWLLLAIAAGAQGQTPPTQVGGRIERDTIWRGQVSVIEDLIISHATLHVEPGTVVTFAPTGVAPARIILHGTRGKPTRLELAGTEQSPIVVTTAADHPRGSIVVPMASDRPWKESDSMAIPHGGLTASYTTFERLGDRRISTGPKPQPRPAIHLQLVNPTNRLELSTCRFRSCGPLLVNFVSDECQATVNDCTFEDSLDDMAIELYGSGRGAKVLRGNRADAAFRVLLGTAQLADNLLIGPQACLLVTAPADSGVAIRGNYVHNTTDQDTGQFCLRCTDPEAVIEDNVLAGATWVVQSGSKKMTGNVLVGQAGLFSQKLGITTTTHQLISTLPEGAEVTDNVLLGPTYAHLATSRGCRNPVICRNIFDGGGVSGRGVHLNALASEKVQAHIENNVFVGFKRAVIYDEAGLPESVASCHGNVFADSERLFELAGDACHPEDATQRTRQLLGYPPLSEIHWEGFEADLVGGNRDVHEIITAIRARYPLPTEAGQATKAP